MVAAAFDAIFTIAANGQILSANRGAAEMFGYEAEELIGRSVVDLMPEREAEAERASVEQSGVSTWTASLDRVRTVGGLRPSGEVFRFRITVREIVREGQTHYICIGEDQTGVDRARQRVLDLHERLQNANEHLEREVSLRTRQHEGSIEALSEANRRLALEARERQTIAHDLQRREVQFANLLRKERELGDLRTRFVNVASHEFRTPLTAMLSSVDVIEMSLPTRTPMVQKHISRIREHIGHLRNVLETFLQLGQLEARGTELHVREVDLRTLLRAYVDDLSLLCKPGQEIIAELDEALATTRHSANGLRILLTNLVTNAIKYSPEGAVIYMSCERHAHTRGDRLRLSVRDEGIGIPDEELGHLFQRFYRASNAAAVKGTGLGLSICRQYAQAMGGTIGVVATRLGVGTTIVAELPYELEGAG